MQHHGFRIGGTALSCGLLLAPMAGVTDAAFRTVCRAHGAEYTVTEMISAKALWYHDKKTASLAHLTDGEMPAAVQIFGSEPECMAYAAKTLSDPETSPAGRVPTAIDINMGCPMPKIANSGDGAALMKDPVLAGKIIEAVRGATDLPVTVKIRSGWDSAHKNCVEIAEIAAALGVSMVAVHGRTRAQMYAPPVDYDSIKAVRQALPDTVPVVGNGDIMTGGDALRMFSETECDGVMVARGAEGNPWIFEEIRAKLDGTEYTPPDAEERIRTALWHLSLLAENKGDYTGTQEGRKHAAWYTKGLRGSAALRADIMRAETPEELSGRLTEFLRQSAEDAQEPAEKEEPTADHTAVT